MVEASGATVARVLICGLLLSGCNAANVKNNTAAIAGGVLGVLVGDVLCKDERTDVRNACRVAGAAMGAAIGKSVGDRLKDADRRRHAAATAEVLAKNGPHAESGWNNPAEGTSGKVTVSRENQSKQVSSLPVLKDRVASVQPLELIGEVYKADTRLNVRVGPGSDYKITQPGLSPGQTFNIVGRVMNHPQWLMISQAGAAVGYVHADHVSPLGMVATAEPVLNPAADSVQVETVSSCKTVTHEIKYGDGQVEKKSVNMCPQADGSWKLV